MPVAMRVMSCANSPALCAFRNSIHWLSKGPQIEPQRLRFILTEGKYRQIRRMCELVGLEVVDLHRIRIGPLSLGDLPEGRWRHLTPSEREALIVSARP